MGLRLLNSTEELNSFPITQSIKLASDTILEANDLTNCIYLFQLSRKDNLLNLAHPTGFDLSTAKDRYTPTKLLCKQEVISNENIITVSPIDPLVLNCSYLLYITSQISEPFMQVNKLASKSTSEVKVKPVSYVINKPVYVEIEVINTTKITTTHSITKLKILNNNVETIKLLDTSVSSKLILDDIEIDFISKVYVAGEKFIVVVEQRQTLDTDLSYVINTADDLNIIPLLVSEPSQDITNQDILDFYSTSLQPTLELKFTDTYIDTNVLDIKLPLEVSKIDIQINQLKVSLKQAFNNYLLTNMKLYDSTLKYVVKVIWIEDDKVVRLVVLYREDSVADQVTIDLSEW